MTTEEELFNSVVKGKYPIGTGVSSARFWVPREEDAAKIILQNTDGSTKEIDGLYVPRPDRNIASLQWYSLLGGFFGLDHFYLRSPGTAVAKLLTLGGMGLWWLWDVLQVFTEEHRVLNYGISTPFDFQTGIGQGLLYKGDSEDCKYAQHTDFGTWVFATIFGFTGADMFTMGKFWLGMRKFIILIIAIGVVAPILVVYANQGLWAAVKYGTFLGEAGFIGTFYNLFAFSLCIALFIMWFGDISRIFFSPHKILEEGMPVGDSAFVGLRWYDGLYLNSAEIKSVEGEQLVPEDVSPHLQKEWKVLRENYRFNKEGTPPEEMRAAFWIGYEGEIPTSKHGNEPAGLPPLTLFMRVLRIIWDWIVEFVKMCWKAIFDKKGMAKSMVVAVGGAREKVSDDAEPLSLEATLMGAVIVALIAGGSLKGVVDYIMKE